MKDSAASEKFIKAPEWFAEPEKKFAETASFIRREFASIAEAESYAVSLNVQAALGDDLWLANLVTEFLTQLAERGVALPSQVSVDAKEFAAYGSKAYLIPAKTVEETIYVNPGSQTWRNPVSAAARVYQSRFWSTPHPLHPLYHEAAHILLGTSREVQRPLTPRQMTIAASVSSRAKEDEEEFVCEVFAGLFTGVEYDNDIIRLYKRLGGKIP